MDDSSNDLEDIDDESQSLICAICYELLFEPMTLPCGHTYCFTCLCKLDITRSIKECPACKEKWTNWPKPNYVIADLVVKKFPKRFALREKEKGEEAQQRRREVEETIARNKTHRAPILTQELKLLLLAIFLGLLFWWKLNYGPM